MKLKINIIQKNDFSELFKDKIQKAIMKVLEKTEEKLEIPQLDIIIDNDSNLAIPETGIGGSSNSNLILIHIDSSFKNIEKDIKIKIQRTFSHEVNHVVRNLHFPWNDANLLETFITEGLADHFDIEINGGEPYPWSVALSEDELLNYFEKATEEGLFLKDCDYSSWFFGSEEKNIPRWTGYSIGFKLVGNYMKKTGKSASELTNIPAENFIK